MAMPISNPLSIGVGLLRCRLRHFDRLIAKYYYIHKNIKCSLTSTFYIVLLVSPWQLVFKRRHWESEGGKCLHHRHHWNHKTIYSSHITYVTQNHANCRISIWLHVFSINKSIYKFSLTIISTNIHVLPTTNRQRANTQSPTDIPQWQWPAFVGSIIYFVFLVSEVILYFFVLNYGWLLLHTYCFNMEKILSNNNNIRHAIHQTDTVCDLWIHYFPYQTTEKKCWLQIYLYSL